VIDEPEPAVDVGSAPQEGDGDTVGGGGQQAITENNTGTAAVSSPEGSADETSMSTLSKGGSGRTTSDSPTAVGFIHLAIEPGILLHESRTAAIRVFVGGLLLLLLCVPVFYLVTKRSIAPLRKLILMANKLASGESAEKVNLKEGSALGSIAELLNIMNDLDLEHKRLVVQSDEQATQLSLSEQELSKATEEINASRELLHRLANYDRLTSLPNRHLFSQQLGVLLRQCARNSQTLAVLLLKLEDFKRINDSLGRYTGDLLLREVAGRLLGCVRQSDVLGHHVEGEEDNNVARLGGDEFALVLSQLDNADAAKMVAKRITNVLSEPMLIDSHELVINPKSVLLWRLVTAWR
jgi:diguanylate cyclase (GGDEF)-like protein